MLIEDRRRKLLEAVNAKGSLTVSEAEKALEVSRMTVHRDLDVLAAQGLVRKVHGGVVAVQQRGADLFDPRARPFEERLAANRDAKRAIAKHVAKLVAKASTLLLDASSTVYHLSETLVPEGRELFVTTGSLPLFSELVRRGGMRVALHGGEPHARTGSLVGPLALASLGDLRFDFAVISALGVLEEEGAAFVSNQEEADVKRSYLGHARKKILAIDSSKFGQSAPFKLGAIGDYDFVVTEKGVLAPHELVGAARRRSADGRVTRASH
jgi:DeoR/GlpR family transcriptional regulator of sugar metabolism